MSHDVLTLTRQQANPRRDSSLEDLSQKLQLQVLQSPKLACLRSCMRQLHSNQLHGKRVGGRAKLLNIVFHWLICASHTSGRPQASLWRRQRIYCDQVTNLCFTHLREAARIHAVLEEYVMYFLPNLFPNLQLNWTGFASGVSLSECSSELTEQSL